MRRKALGPANPETLDSMSLLALDAFWEAEHNLLALYGLPNDRAGLRRFLEAFV